MTAVEFLNRFTLRNLAYSIVVLWVLALIAGSSYFIYHFGLLSLLIPIVITILLVGAVGAFVWAVSYLAEEKTTPWWDKYHK